jgi:alanine racemase
VTSAAVYAEINLNAVRHNFLKVKECAPNSRVMAVIKANAYGHGMARIANALECADAFAVARVIEGRRLRQTGFSQRIVVLQGFSDSDELQDSIEYGLEPVIHSHYQLKLIETLQGRKEIFVWLKIDTGMNRLGFKSEEVESVYQRLKSCPKIRFPLNLMTHLACADDKSSDFTELQIRLFKSTVEKYGGERSIGNSAGILAWPEAISDWIRPGLMLYGISPFFGITGAELGLKPVMSLHSKLIAVKPVEKGEAVGYSNSWVCEKDTTIGIVAIGYGDGYPRHTSEGTPVLVNGLRVSLIGKVSMDMIIVDLATQPDAKPGDRVTLWGNQLPVEEIARYAKTIPYTLVTGLTQRVQFIETSSLQKEAVQPD